MSHTAEEQTLEVAKAKFQEYMRVAELIRESGISPDYIIGEDYLQRWWLTKDAGIHDAEKWGEIKPHTRTLGIKDWSLYLHRMTGSDDDIALHDHPSVNVSLIIQGSYREHTPVGSVVRTAGDMVYRRGTDLHRLELLTDECWSLFLMGKKIREWGFDCNGRWVHWKEFTGFNETGDSSRVGRGCGED